MEKNYDKYTNLLNSNIQVPNKNTLKYQNCGNVLITGATGFLGMHVLESFINKEKGKAYCIEIGRAHVWTPVTWPSRMPSSAWKKKKKKETEETTTETEEKEKKEETE